MLIAILIPLFFILVVVGTIVNNEVSVVIDEISSVVQNNSATAEENAATSEELAALVQVMRDLTDKFKIDKQYK